MADCFAKALELEGEFQVGEVVSADADTQILMALAAGEQEEVNEITGTGEADRRTPAYNPNPCFHCKEIGHFKRDCPLLNSPVPVIAGKLHHTLDVETPVGKEMLDDFLSKLLRSERRGAKLLAKLHKERQQNVPRQYPPGGGWTTGGTRPPGAQPPTGGDRNRGGAPQLSRQPPQPANGQTPRKTVRFNRGPSAATPAQTRSRGKVAIAPGDTQSKTAVVIPGKPIIKTEPDPAATVREVQSDDEDSYTPQELEELANLPTDSEAEDLVEAAC